VANAWLQPDCKKDLLGGWIGLRKCYPDSFWELGAPTVTESARRCFTRWVDLRWLSFPHGLEQRRVRPFLSLSDVSGKPERIEDSTDVTGVREKSPLACGIPKLREKIVFLPSP
jgi:hypothetical protein